MSAEPGMLHFLGGGALLHQAADYSLRAGLRVGFVCCPRGDSAIPKLRARGLTVVESDDPNEDLPPLIGARGHAVAFSINNRRIIKDELLAGGIRFFNIHNGLVQDYRGIAEVCIFAALCAGDARYGVTLQRPDRGADRVPDQTPGPLSRCPAALARGVPKSVRVPGARYRLEPL
jgi:hypothetical protein